MELNHFPENTNTPSICFRLIGYVLAIIIMLVYTIITDEKNLYPLHLLLLYCIFMN